MTPEKTCCGQNVITCQFLHCVRRLNRGRPICIHAGKDYPKWSPYLWVDSTAFMLTLFSWAAETQSVLQWNNVSIWIQNRTVPCKCVYNLNESSAIEGWDRGWYYSSYLRSLCQQVFCFGVDRLMMRFRHCVCTMFTHEEPMVCVVCQCFGAHCLNVSTGFSVVSWLACTGSVSVVLYIQTVLVFSDTPMSYGHKMAVSRIIIHHP
jgi:hypothetical protein